MNFSCLVYPVICFSLVLSPVVSSAQGQNEPDSSKKQHQIWNQLKLNDDQKAKLKDLYRDMKQIRTEYGENMKAVREKAKTELLKNNPSKTVLYGYAKELGDLERSFAEKRADHLLKAKAIFTPEQFTRVIDSRMGEGDGMWRKGGKGTGGPGPHPEGKEPPPEQ